MMTREMKTQMDCKNTLLSEFARTIAALQSRNQEFQKQLQGKDLMITHLRSELMHQATTKLNEQRGRTCGSEDPRTNVHVRGIPLKWSEQDLSRYFSEYGPVLSINLWRDYRTQCTRGVALVDFKDALSAQQCILNPNHCILGHAGPLTVTYAVVKSKQNEQKRREAHYERPSSPPPPPFLPPSPPPLDEGMADMNLLRSYICPSRTRLLNGEVL